MCDISGISGNHKVLPSPAERALALFSPPSCDIFSIANPHRNDKPGAIIAFPGETFGLADQTGKRG